MSASLNRFDRFALSSIVALLLGLAAGGALAQGEIVVSTAEPDTTEQGTYDLEVMVGGDNFPSDPEVDFFVTGSSDPGGITVKKVKRQGPKNLKVTIDVAEDAQFQLKFDIEVRSRGNGRSGKGTELFAVTEKQHPTQDTTPPGAVTVTYLGTSFNEVFVEWIAPADDGYDPASGPAQIYDTKCVEGVVVIDSENWGDELTDGCGTGVGHVPGAPGTLESIRLVGPFLPSTTYSLAVRARDDNWNRAEVSNTVTFTTDAFAPDPTWIVQRAPVSLNHSLGHGFDAAGNPMVLGLYQDRVRIARGSWNAGSGLWDWDLEDLPVAGDSFALDDFGMPAFGWMEPLSLKRSRVLYTFFDGSGWVTEIVEGTRGRRARPVSVAFDADGRPALAYYDDDNRSRGVKLARRSAAGQWSIDVVQAIAVDPELALAFDPSGNPAVAYAVDLTGDGEADVVRFATLVSGVWHVEDVDSPPRDGLFWEVGTAVQLVFDAARGDFALVHNPLEVTRYCERAGQSWQCAEVFRGETPDGGQYAYLGQEYVSAPNRRWLAIDGFGEAFISYQVLGSQRLARSLDGVSWSHDFVDYSELRPEFQDLGPDTKGPHLALDPSGRPTLSWIWLRDDWQPGDWTLYFAWKAP